MDQFKMEQQRKILLDPENYDNRARAASIIARVGEVVKSDTRLLAESLGGSNGKDSIGMKMVYELFTEIFSDEESPGIDAPDTEFTGPGNPGSGVGSYPYIAPNPSVDAEPSASALPALGPPAPSRMRRRTVFQPRHSDQRKIVYSQVFERHKVKPGSKSVTFFDDRYFQHQTIVAKFHIAVYPTTSREAAMRFLDSMCMDIFVHRKLEYTLLTPALRVTQRHHKFDVGTMTVGGGIGVKLVLRPFGDEGEENPQFDIEEPMKITACIEFMEDKPVR